MDKLKPVPKIFLLLTSIFFAIWLGSYIARQIAVYQLFEPIDLNLQPIYNVSNLAAVISIIIPLIILNLISYIFFLILFIIFLSTSKINLKLNGWLFIISLIVFITAPFEIYLSTIDFKIISLGLKEITDPNLILGFIKERLTILSSFSLIETFSYLAIIYLVIFKPLQKNEN